MTEKRTTDWEGIQREHRAGIRSLREIGAEFGVSHVAIKKRADKDGWERDLGAKIRAKADALVTKEAVTSLVTVETKLAEKDIVDANATIQATIRREHRTDIQRTKRIANRLLEALEGIALPEMPTTGSKAERQQASAILIGVIKEHASVTKQLADTQRVTVNMEREAFGIAAMVEAPPQEQVELTEARITDGARRIAFLLRKAATLTPSKG